MNTNRETNGKSNSGAERPGWAWRWLCFLFIAVMLSLSGCATTGGGSSSLGTGYSPGSPDYTTADMLYSLSWVSEEGKAIMRKTAGLSADRTRQAFATADADYYFAGCVAATDVVCRAFKVGSLPMTEPAYREYTQGVVELLAVNLSLLQKQAGYVTNLVLTHYVLERQATLARVKGGKKWSYTGREFYRDLNILFKDLAGKAGRPRVLHVESVRAYAYLRGCLDATWWTAKILKQAPLVGRGFSKGELIVKLLLLEEESPEEVYRIPPAELILLVVGLDEENR